MTAGAGAAGYFRDVALIDDAVDTGRAAAFRAIESVIDGGHDPRRFATDLLERFRTT